MSREKATFVSFVMFGMLMGSMFLLPVFTQESLHYTATLSGVVLLPRTLAMMFMSPFVGRMVAGAAHLEDNGVVGRGLGGQGDAKARRVL